MLKFVKGYMESIDGVATYPMISLLIFFVFFTLLFWWVFTASKSYIKEVSELPLEEDNQQNLEL
ncbi:CcoQ/FixQ family Cbb3-type cytochrome c oxidase assembly chaperone [Zobellia galactanivorans]|uniref:Cytochrome cbb3 oxidase, CcoQ subunit n=2 Tax=Zobellia TaxID=112040 RepID=G0LBS4_ZOBGA|nr:MULTISPECIES: cytochrome cbb3 oxidase subunit CcoQ [Zobellia]MBU3026196.1 CcoQ/FixQ family Cbb3-type cytochrome c oxidase assembly chaperone [Zobellia galactanivorans]MDO6517364.1 CcoQ/FixQ family Cbb3-type cytochrome c oxidase assembly chaperone [Zobellia uliginosa]MDO6807327.1 CcoQ/FixQ family Cbb3-type cytochrome c oxidase assembly chaperone [Zobellia galactanivorans]OWW27273.1 cytochrome C oxidase subunit IV [Zobellia sp. OII3]CAZ96412.1 Cytochrome cbb3 oxidase, CcoQ subunit [Zobellia g